MSTIKCVVVGDHSAGKTELLIAYTKPKLDYVPSFFHSDDCGAVTLMSGGKPYSFDIVDMSNRGGEDYARLRPLHYPCTDVFVVCFSIASPASWENVREEVNNTLPSLAQ